MKRDADYYSKLAKSKGYPARSIFKLKEIQEKYLIVRQNDRVLEIGSSPGSWSLYLLKELKLRGSILAVDIIRDKSLPIGFKNYTFVQADIMDDSFFDLLSKKGRFDVILSDAAPSTSGNRFVDSYKSYELSERVMEIALNSLKIGGNLVIKILQGEKTSEFRDELKKYFAFSKLFKPLASRSESSEIFLIAMNFKG